MENQIDRKKERATDIFKSYFLKEKIFICPDQETYVYLILFINNMQVAPSVGDRTEFANLIVIRENQTRTLTREENNNLKHFDVWEKTREVFKDLIAKTEDGGFINANNSLIREVEQLRNVYQLIVDFVLFILFKEYTHIAFLEQGT